MWHDQRMAALSVVAHRPDLDGPWIPQDTFGARLALIRQRLGWNVSQAAAHTGQIQSSWKRWEQGRRPREYVETCRAIADATGCDFQWLLLGGDLHPPERNSRHFLPDLRLVDRQLELRLFPHEVTDDRRAGGPRANLRLVRNG
jgi:transcriptional regulator with XRE-family HTH domain